MPTPHVPADRSFAHFYQRESLDHDLRLQRDLFGQPVTVREWFRIMRRTHDAMLDEQLVAQFRYIDAGARLANAHRDTLRAIRQIDVSRKLTQLAPPWHLATLIALDAENPPDFRPFDPSVYE